MKLIHLLLYIFVLHLMTCSRLPIILSDGTRLSKSGETLNIRNSRREQSNTVAQISAPSAEVRGRSDVKHLRSKEIISPEVLKEGIYLFINSDTNHHYTP
jgi:hypothetical protein